MSDDIIDIEDYEVKDKQIIETTDEDDFQNEYNQREYTQRDYNQREDDQGNFSGYYKSVSLNNTSLIIILMVIILLAVIFIMNFE